MAGKRLQSIRSHRRLVSIAHGGLMKRSILATVDVAARGGCAVLLTLFLMTVNVLAQTNLGQGVRPYDSIDGGPLDSISLTTGGLSLHIPLVSFPQRGDLDLSFAIRASNKQWWIKPPTISKKTGEPSGSFLWQPAANSGAQIVSSTDWLIQTSYSVEGCEGCQTTYDWSQGVSSPDGDVHPLGAGSGTTAPTYPLRSLDATGLLHPNAQTVIMPNGTRYSYAVTGTGNTAGPNGDKGGVQANTITDANGNRVTIDSSGWTDTMGRFLPGSGSGSFTGVRPGVSTTDLTNCPSGTASALLWSVPGIGGANRTFKFCYSAISLATQFNPGSAPIDYSGTLSLLTAVVFPNLTQCTFSYDNYGNVSRFVLPTGGSISYTYTLAPAATVLTSQTPSVARRTVHDNHGTPSVWNN